MKFAKNRCMKCSFEWQDRPGAFAQFDECPACGSLYWRWLNAEEFGIKRKT